jgi:hypothetical protein
MYASLQRFPFGSSRLILQYSLHRKNEGKIAPRFLLWENHTFKTRNIFCQHQKSSDFERKSRKIISFKIKSGQFKKKTLYVDFHERLHSGIPHTISCFFLTRFLVCLLYRQAICEPDRPHDDRRQPGDTGAVRDLG